MDILYTEKLMYCANLISLYRVPILTFGNSSHLEFRY